jgi:chitin disaccharide deacetylase
MKTIVLCADDYGQNQFISQAIIALLEQGSLSAVSCLTTAAEWQNAAKLLAPFKNKVDIGLHFNLTEGPLASGMKAMPLSSLILRAYWRLLDAAKIERELNAQLDAFISAMGQLPDFLDGHQHIHQLPVIRDVVFKVYEQRLRQKGSYLRCVYDEQLFIQQPSIKKLTIQLLGAGRFKRQLIKRNIPHNRGFSGIYSFKDAARYAHLFPLFLRNSSDKGLIMCHPGYLTDRGGDSIVAARSHEFHYLVSEQFKHDCSIAQVKLGRLEPIVEQILIK